MIDRSLFKEIKTLLRQFPAVAIMGARQVGKTTLAKKIAEGYKSLPFILTWKTRWM